MPATPTGQTQYIGAASLPALNSSSLYYPGDIGKKIIDTANHEYQTVLCDSGPASVAAGDVAFWKDRSSYTVTNKLADAPAGRNGIAGVFQLIVTPGNYCRIQIGGSSNVPVKTSGAPNQGMIAVANSGTGSDVVGIPAGTAPTYVPLGVFSGEPSAGKTAVNITIGAMSATP